MKHTLHPARRNGPRRGMDLPIPFPAVGTPFYVKARVQLCFGKPRSLFANPTMKRKDPLKFEQYENLSEYPRICCNDGDAEEIEPNLYFDPLENDNRMMCKACPAGSVPRLYGYYCESCPPGTEPADDVMGCVPCKSGFSKGSFGSEKCQPCSSNSSSRGSAETNVTIGNTQC